MDKDNLNMQHNGRQSAKWKAVTKVFLSVIAVVLIVFCATNLAESFDSLATLPWGNHPWLLLSHILLVALVYMIFLTGWTIVLRACSQKFSFAGAVYCWLAANAGKYVPGKVFMFASRVTLCSKVGIRKSAGFWALAVEHFFMLLATFPFLALIFLQGYKPDTVFGYALCSVVLVTIILMVKPQLFMILINKMLIYMQREPLQVAPSPANLILLLGVYFAAWALYGLSGVVLINVLEIQTSLSGPVIASAFVVSWLIGFLSIFTPGGLGVREAALVLLLQPSIAAPQALALAVLARATWTSVEIVGAGIGWWLGKGRKDNE